MKNSTALFLWVFCFTILCSFVNAQNEYVLATNNPFEVISKNKSLAVTLGDIDDDGDLDLFIGQVNSNNMLFYRNIGSPSSPMYEEQIGDNNPLDVFLSNSGCISPNLIDIDDDGDLDVFAGTWDGSIRFYRNDGTKQLADFLPFFGDNNPLDLVNTDGDCSYPEFVDVDDDGDYDVFISDGDGSIEFYRNIGSANSAIFELDSGTNPFNGITFSARVNLAFEDVSGDGVVDVIVSHDIVEPEIRYFENTGTKEDINLEEKTGNDNPFDGITGSVTLMPSFADIDDDNDVDLILGMTRSVVLYEASPPSSVQNDGQENPFTIAPNPNNGRFEIRGTDQFDFKVWSSTGVLIESGSSKIIITSIDLSNRTNGVYYLHLKTEANSFVSRIVVQ